MAAAVSGVGGAPAFDSDGAGAASRFSDVEAPVVG